MQLALVIGLFACGGSMFFVDESDDLPEATLLATKIVQLAGGWDTAKPR